MQITNQLPTNSFFANHRNQNVQQDQYIKDANMSGVSGDIKNVETKEIAPQESIDPTKRQTYGLLVLELMSDDEYRAFQRATATLNESEKIFAAQSLYRLKDFYRGKVDIENHSNNAYAQNNEFIKNFLQRFQNAKSYEGSIDF